MADFIHLHCHTHYTLLESPLTVPALVDAAASAGMPAVALTDRGTLTGAFEFQEATAKAKIKGIIGCQVNIAPLGMRERTPDRMQLVLLAMTRRGYFNLVELVSRGWLEGFYYEPRVDLDCLAEHAEDLICLTGVGPDGYLNRHLLVGADDEADRQAGLLREIFGDRLYVELADHGTEGPVSARAAASALAKRCQLPVVATNWVHYGGPTDAEVHDVQLAVQKATSLADPRRKRMPSEEFWFKDGQAMATLFDDEPAAIANSLAIAERCEAAVIPTGTYHLPVFTCPDSVDLAGYRQTLAEDEYAKRYLVDINDKPRGLDETAIAEKEQTDAYLAECCVAGVRQRYDTITEGIQERLDFELATIARMGFSAYFLIVSDFINWAKENDIPVGPGRGSAAGSLVAYSLGITDICPLRYGLLFERFLNPGRVSMPDIDIDFCKDRRAEVIDYVAEKYGRDAVTQIMTLGTMKARMAIKDVARAYDWTPEDAQGIANLVPEDPSGKHTIPVCLGKKALKNGEFDPSDAMVARYESDDRTHQLLDTATALENLGRNLGVHACGVIIAPGPVHRYVPVCAVKGKPATQYNMVQVEDCGLLKMDFLGLKTMSILKKAADIVKATEGVHIDYPTLPLDDANTFRLLGDGETLGVFQCESSGFQQLIRLLQPDRFEDMIALVALYRPGPLQAGMHTSYCDRKHGREAVDYPHPVLEGVLKETFGLFIYQEQVMNISRELCGFSPSEADNLRKAMGKKKLDVLEKMKSQFIEGAWQRHQFDKAKCQAMWDKILGFASYCFNKSHSACYGLIAYWTAYMKANHYAAFMTANLIYEMGNKDKMTLFIQEMRTKEVAVLPPDVNESGWEFTWTGEAVRYGFGGIKGVGEGAAEHLIAERKANGLFASLYDICERVDTRTVNKRVIDHLIKVGALDSLHDNRHALSETVDRAFDRGHRIAKTRAQSQTTLFDTFESEDHFREATLGYVDAADWSESERLAFEKALTGYWMSSHPLVEHLPRLQRYARHQAKDLASYPDEALTIPAVIVGKRDIKTRTGKHMSVLQLEDLTGRFEAVLFPGRQNRRGQQEPGAYDKFNDLCEVDLVALFTGRVDTRRRQPPRQSAPSPSEEDEGAVATVVEEDHVEELPSLLIEDLVPVHLLTERLTREVVITLAADDEANDERLAQTERVLTEHNGSCPLRFMIQTGEALVTLQVADHWQVHPTDDLLRALQDIWGSERVIAVTR